MCDAVDGEVNLVQRLFTKLLFYLKLSEDSFLALKRRL